MHTVFAYFSLNYKADVGNGAQIEFERNPFSSGTSRYALKGILKDSQFANGKKCVVKVFKSQYANQIRGWDPDIQASVDAEKFASKFNSKNLQDIDRVKFLIPRIANITAVPFYHCYNPYVRVNDKVAVEDFLPGEYMKFNSNTAYEDEHHLTMAAFSHWTWDISQGRKLVCDLQVSWLFIEA